MDLSEYQIEALETAKPGSTDFEDRLRYAMGAADEASEIIGAFKKWLRGDFDEVELKSRVEAEIGDTLWYLAVLAHNLDMDLSEVAFHNVEKLRGRDERDMIRGDGDDR